MQARIVLKTKIPEGNLKYILIVCLGRQFNNGHIILHWSKGPLLTKTEMIVGIQQLPGRLYRLFNGRFFSDD